MTGSARLDIYRKGGDSLMGRYHYYRRHPFSVAEFLGKEEALQPFEEIRFGEVDPETRPAFEALLKFGGFPEPLIKQSERALRRWHHERVDRVVREDIRDLENLRDLSSLQVLVEVLPGKVGSLLSVNSLREDLLVAHKTIVTWLEVLDRFWYHFRVYPFSDRRIKSLRKSAKLYLWDWSEVRHDEGARLENLVASHLLKLCHRLTDAEGYRTELHFLRDAEGREVDFLVTEGGQPWFAVEVKASFKGLARPLLHFGRKLTIPFLYQVVADPNVDVQQDTVRVVSADRFLAALV